MNDPDKLRERLAEAIAICDDLELSEDDRASVLSELLNLLSADHVQMEETAISGLGFKGAIPRGTG